MEKQFGCFEATKLSSPLPSTAAQKGDWKGQRSFQESPGRNWMKLEDEYGHGVAVSPQSHASKLGTPSCFRSWSRQEVCLEDESSFFFTEVVAM